MTLAIVGLPRTRYVLDAAVGEARTMGLDVVLVDDWPGDWGGAAPWLREAEAQGEFRLVRAPLDNLDAAASVLRPLNCSLVVSLTEMRMVIAAGLRARLGLPGESEAVERAVIDKHATRALLAERGLTKARFVLADGDGLTAALHAVGLPAVVKPRRLTGSIGVRFVDSLEVVGELRAAYRRHPMIQAEEYLVESFVEGTEVSVEGLVVAGTFHPYAMTDKRTTGRPHFIETGHSLPSAQSGLLPAASKYLAAVVEALGITTAPIHAELKLAADRPELIEIHTRHGGDHITRLLHEALGCNVFSDYFAALKFATPPNIGRPARGVASVEFLTVGPGRFQGLTFPDWLACADGVVETAVYVEPPAEITCDVVAVERVGHVIWLSPDHAHADAQRLRLLETTRVTLDMAASP